MIRIYKGLFLLITLIYFSCSNPDNNPVGGIEQSKEKSKLLVSFSMKTAPAEIVRIVGILSRTGFETIEKDFSISGDSATCEYANITIGNWHLRVNALDNLNAIKFAGETDVQVNPGSVTPVFLVLDPVSGGISIKVFWGTTSASGNGMVFDAIDDYVQIKQSNTLDNIDSALTMEAWVKPYSQSYNYIICKGSGPIQYSMELVNSLQPAITLGGVTIDYTGASNYWSRLMLNQSLQAGKWCHLAFVFHYTGGISIYINGVLAHHANSQGPITKLQDPVRFGLYNNAYYDLHFNGEIDEVRIWNVARTQGEIIASMKKELTGLESGLVGYWNFNQSTGATVLPDKAMQNDGTIFGNPVFVPSKIF
jgi:hypothetical protein